MKDLDDFRKAIDAYRVTMIVMSILVIIICTIFGYIVMFSVPQLVGQTVHKEVKQAVTEAFDAAIESTNAH